MTSCEGKQMALWLIGTHLKGLIIMQKFNRLLLILAILPFIYGCTNNMETNSMSATPRAPTGGQQAAQFAAQTY